jgi:hypothetical protein
MKKKIRKQINISGKAKCPICCRQEILVEHHIEGRKIPNANHPSNLANICDNCHRKIHLGKIIIEGWFQTTAGKELFWHEANEDSFTGRNAQTYIEK